MPIDHLGESSSRRKTAIVFLGVAVVIALSIWTLLWFAERQDNPESDTQVVTRKFAYRGITGMLTLSCTCPPYLIEHRQYWLLFDVKMKLSGGSYLNQAGAPEDLWLRAVAPSAGVNGGSYLAPVSTLASGGTVVTEIPLENVEPKDKNLRSITFTVITQTGDHHDTGTISERISWTIMSRQPFLVTFEPIAYASLAFSFAVAALYWADWKLRLLREQRERRVADAMKRVQENPEKASFAWEAASVNLQAYFDRNLLQVKMVFGVGVLVVVVGLAFVLWGAMRSINLAAYSGIATQFIGAMFMVVYRSTMAQANEFMSVLDRINTVGMAVNVLDSIPESQSDLKNSTRAQIVQLLLAANRGRNWVAPSGASRSEHRSTKPAAHAVSKGSSE